MSSNILKSACLSFLLLSIPLVPGTAAETAPQNQSDTFKAEEIAQLVAPIALYPDKLLAQVLMASTYPFEVAQAAQFVKNNESLKGQALDAAVEKQSWDQSVKILVQFPAALQMMSDKLEWMQKLGDAFLAQNTAVLNEIQVLRKKARDSGFLKDTNEQRIVTSESQAHRGLRSKSGRRRQHQARHPHLRLWNSHRQRQSNRSRRLRSCWRRRRKSQRSLPRIRPSSLSQRTRARYTSRHTIPAPLTVRGHIHPIHPIPILIQATGSQRRVSALLRGRPLAIGGTIPTSIGAVGISTSTTISIATRTSIATTSPTTPATEHGSTIQPTAAEPIIAILLRASVSAKVTPRRRTRAAISAAGMLKTSLQVIAARLVRAAADRRKPGLRKTAPRKTVAPRQGKPAERKIQRHKIVLPEMAATRRPIAVPRRARVGIKMRALPTAQTSIGRLKEREHRTSLPVTAAHLLRTGGVTAAASLVSIRVRKRALTAIAAAAAGHQAGSRITV